MDKRGKVRLLVLVILLIGIFSLYFVLASGDEEEISGKPSITGATIGTLLSSNSLIAIITILSITFIVFIIVTSRTILHISKNK